jgi:glutamate-1-semialdehyde aminotransferase/spore coat polysaccharide biosynthesis protein SpsF (cytidylyltransferase family)
MRVVALIQARMGSTRLPNKVMKPVQGIPMIELLLRRLSGATLVDEIVVATSTEPANQPLVEHISNAGFSIFEGSENDVLDRFYQAATMHEADVIVRVTADCPLIDPNLVDQLIAEFLKRGDLDYMANALPPTYPDGLDTEVFTYQALKYAAENAELPIEREHVTGFIVRSGLFRVGNLPYHEDHSQERWTVDQIEDFQVIESIYNHFLPDHNFGWLQVLKLKREHPHLFYPNQKIMRNEGFMLGKFKEITLRNIVNFEASNNYRSKIHTLIPGGAHTYSKGDDQFPELSPAAISHGKGSHVWDIDGNEFIDCSMGLSSVSLGHAYEPVLDAVREELTKGVNFQRPSVLEREMAETFLELVPQHDMVKFAKNGSAVTTAAVKLARAKTGRKLVAFPGDHPFYSYDDWFIGTTPCNKGVPKEFADLSLTFKACDINSLKVLFDQYPGQIACVITEPEKNMCSGCTCGSPGEFLKQAIELAHANGALFILDEMVTGFKTGFPGSISKFGIEPDMATWGKGIANGFSFCAITGKKDVMDLGGIKRKGEEKVFLISTTHGGETHAMAASIATIKEFKKHNVVEYINNFGTRVIEICQHLVSKHGLDPYIQVVPSKWMPAFAFKDANGNVCAGLRTLVMQEMIRRGVLFQGVFIISYSHTEEDLFYFCKAFEEVLELYKKAVTEGYEKYLVGEKAEAVFRRIL